MTYNTITHTNSPSQYNNHYKTTYAYITVEDNSNTENMNDIVEDLLDTQEPCYTITCIERNEDYFVIKVEYDSWDDIKDLCSTISYLLLHYEIGSFSFTCKAEELMNEYD